MVVKWQKQVTTQILAAANQFGATERKRKKQGCLLLCRLHSAYIFSFSKVNIPLVGQSVKGIRADWDCIHCYRKLASKRDLTDGNSVVARVEGRWAMVFQE